MEAKESYPYKQGNFIHYLKYPVQGLSGKWRAADLIIGRYEDPFKNPDRRDFDTFEACREACSIVNNQAGYYTNIAETLLKRYKPAQK